MAEDEVLRLFAAAQLEAFECASQGHFFWNWTEAPGRTEWHFQEAYNSGLLSGAALKLPPTPGPGEPDPLEELLDPSPVEPRVLYGDGVYLRVFYGAYLDVEAGVVAARWADRGVWQRFAFVPAHPSARGQEVASGDVVRLQHRTGRFLAVDRAGGVSAVPLATDDTALFAVQRVSGEGPLRHHSVIYIRSVVTSCYLNADEEVEGVAARYGEAGWWQELVLEKATPEVPQTPPRRLSRKQPVQAHSGPKASRAKVAAGATSPMRPETLKDVPTPGRRRASGPSGGALQASAASPSASSSLWTSSPKRRNLAATISPAESPPGAIEGHEEQRPAKVARLR